jgi:diadenosine tetraphosphate (Ap4A) HIT family hydrolase
VGIFDRTLECPFCILIVEGRSPVWDHLFHTENGDEVIFQTESFLVVLDTAPLAEGHLLIITDRHMPSLGGLSKTERDELHAVKRDMESKLRKVYGPITYFEHGAESFTRHAGACIDHAHLHLVPGDIDMLPRVARDYPNIESFVSHKDALDSLAGRAYLMFGRDTGPAYGAHAPACATQYLRRLVSEAAESKAIWNWRDCVRWADALSVREQLLNARDKLHA